MLQTRRAGVGKVLRTQNPDIRLPEAGRLGKVPGKMARSAAANDAMNLSHGSKLIYDVGMNNGDDTAYYLWCGFRVIAIEANPELVAGAAQRFAHEIDAGRLRILNVGITAAEGEFTFWICRTNSKFSSFDPRLASVDGREPHHAIQVPCRKFRSVLEEFGTPYYVKVDIQGNDFLCVEDLNPHQLPNFMSVEASGMSLLALLRDRGFKRFKWISQLNFLPLQLPAVIDQRSVRYAQWLLQTRNPAVRVFRRLGGRYWLQRQVNRNRRSDGWEFPDGSSGPFGDKLPGRWLSYDELHATYEEFLRLRRERPRSVSWVADGLPSFPFWTDFHARSD